jgi:DNA-binding transcriptional LysR family regulator
MDLRQLTYFVSVATHHGFTRASQKLHLSQPTLSKMVRSLEEELGVQLFDRSSKQIELTDIGAVVLDHAQQILKSLDDLTQSIHDVTLLKKGTVKLGIPPIISSLFFAQIIAGFRDKFPGIQIQIVEDGAKMVERHIRNGELDIGIVVRPVDEALFAVYPFASESLQLIVSIDHPLAQREEVDLKELSEEAFVLFREEFALHDRVREACSLAGFNPEVSYESTQWDFIGEMVACNLGVSLLPESICRRFDATRIHTLSISSPKLFWNLAIIVKKESYLSFAARELISFILDSISVKE